MPAKLDLSGEKFNKLTVLYEAPRVASNKSRWQCRCECGNEIAVHTMHLRSGHTKSCGCIPRQNSERVLNAEGKLVRPEGYWSWKSMQSRCYCEGDENYPKYGGRGITICDRWLGKGGLANFLADMGPRPSPLYSVDRKDVNGNYEPDNCRWATDKQQRNNRRDTVPITHFGKSQTMREWEKELGLSRGGIFFRLHRGWSVEKAFSTPRNKTKNKTRQSTESSVIAGLNEGGSDAQASEFRLVD